MLVDKDTHVRCWVTAIDTTEYLSNFTITKRHPLTVRITLYVSTSCVT